MWLPRGLLTRAWHRALTGDAADAKSDLNEACEIAERGPMPLYQADILLTRARLFGRTKDAGGRMNEDEYPWGSAREDLAEARRLIEKHGYHRRDEELADAEAALREWEKAQPQVATQPETKPMSTEPQVVFISYSHDSDEHRERVLGLSERLRQDGFDTQLDRYVNGAPAEGWPRWMLDRLDEAAFVLVVCTETYYRRFRGHEQPDRGKGVDWEGALITQEIYDACSRTLKFVPVLFDAAHGNFIPEPLRSITHYTLNSDANYKSLCEFLNGVAGVEPGPLGTPTPKSRRQASPLTFGGTANETQSEATSPAVRMWQEKLEFLLVEEAKATEAAAKFKIQQDIKEAREKILELSEGNP